jgi:hypothetical protein
MNWYLIASIGVAFLLGWVLGTTAGKAKGYAMAMNQYQQQILKKSMEDQLKSLFKEDDDEQEK